jgi:hypothetical protein
MCKLPLRPALNRPMAGAGKLARCSTRSLNRNFTVITQNIRANPHPSRTMMSELDKSAAMAACCSYQQGTSLVASLLCTKSISKHADFEAATAPKLLFVASACAACVAPSLQSWERGIAAAYRQLTAQPLQQCYEHFHAQNYRAGTKTQTLTSVARVTAGMMDDTHANTCRWH